ncbi:hypothetical protein EXIGLDRAFT_696717 [Exidia glandulosa HHB12029]|uniref:Uncharacterized protein n=1 Tax=Exidia glandulosa HHB12029 TaxID=1314781 RepID=A0A165N2D3_EXIGL|nr:hypothetical protein EXIGLDRAFT_696717 [Exidia glandulosa HHB12029]
MSPLSSSKPTAARRNPGTGSARRRESAASKHRAASCILFDLHTELSDEEMKGDEELSQRSRETYVEVQNKLREAKRAKEYAKNLPRLIDRMIWAPPPSFRAPELLSFWHDTFKAHVESRKRGHCATDGPKPKAKSRDDDPSRGRSGVIFNIASASASLSNSCRSTSNSTGLGRRSCSRGLNPPMPTGVANILPPDDDNEGGRGCGGHESCSCEQRVDDLAHCKGRSKPSFSSGGADVVQMLKLLDGRAEQLCSDTGFCGDWVWDCVQRRDEVGGRWCG